MTTKEKEPWELTRQEFDQVFLGSDVHNKASRMATTYRTTRRKAVFANASPETPVEVGGLTVVGLHNGLPDIIGQNDFGGLSLINSLGLGIDSGSRRTHEYTILQAITEGIKVPQEVLDSYPNE